MAAGKKETSFRRSGAGRRAEARKTPAVTRPTAAALDRLIADATIDAYGESEQAGGFQVMLEERLALPFTTTVFGVEVLVTAIDIGDDDRLVAVCRRGKAVQRIPLVDVRLPSPPPSGYEWIAAYRRWCR